MNRLVAAAIASSLVCFATDALAQSSQATPAAGQSQTTPAPDAAVRSSLWLTAGTAFVTVRGDCQTCEEDFPYRHGPGVFANVGYRANSRMNAGVELFWVPVEAEGATVRTTHIDAVAEFRPWASHGFLLKGGAGLAFVRNWVDGVGPDAINQKALSVVIGTGWLFLRDRPVGVQVVAAQHVSALGDLQTGAGSFTDVIGNFWSIGVGVVLR